MEITKEQLETYEKIRVSGITNMLDVQLVCELSELEEDDVLAIIENYVKLKKKYMV